MASITLAGTLLDPNSALAIGDQIRFTQESNTGQTLKGAVSVVTINVLGTYSVALQYGLVLVEYKDVKATNFKNLGVATVNADNPATSIPELLTALVPVSSADLIAFQAILADSVASKVAAQTAQTAAETAAATTATRKDTFANLVALSPTTTGSTFVCQERAGSEYILQPEGVVAKEGDAVAANSRLIQLQQSSEGWNFNHFGVSSATTASGRATAFQNAIDRAAGSPIVGPGGFYTIDAELLISTSGGGIKSTDGIYIDIKQSTDGLSCLKISPASPESGATLSGNVLDNVRFVRSSSTADQINLKLHSIKSPKINNISSLGSHTAIEMLGCSNIQGSSWLLFSGGGNITRSVGSSLIIVDGYPLTAGGYTPFWTSNITNLIMSGNFVTDHCFNISTCDGLQINNGYLASPFVSHFNLEPSSDGKGIGKLLVNNFYFDGINTTDGSLHAITSPTSSFSNTFVADVAFNSCSMSNFTNDVIKVERNFTNVTFNGGTISNAQGWGVNYTGSNGGSIKLSGQSLLNLGIDGASGGINSVGGGRLIVSGTDFRGIPNAHAIKTNGLSAVTLTGNMFATVASALDDTNSTKYKSVGNISTTETLIDTVDDDTGTFNPSLQFGGGQVGVTYGTREGVYTTVGKLVFFTIKLILTSKGSSTGALAITGLPFNADDDTAVSLDLRTITAGSGDSYLSAALASASATVVIFSIASNGFRDFFDNTDIKDDSQIRISGTYRKE